MFDAIDAHAGQAAGLAASVLWTATSLFFTAAARRIGATAVNTARIALAIVLLGITHRVINGFWVPHALPGQVFLLAMSGIVGLAIGDQALFTAFVDIGPRLATLIMTTSPLFAAMFGWLVLRETLPAVAWAGVGLTVAGVGWVVIDRRDAPPLARRRPSDDPRAGAQRGVAGVSLAAAALSHASRHRVRGILLALVGAICQAGGLLLSKQGMGHGWLPENARISPQAATLIRMVFGGAGVLPIAGFYWWRLRGRPVAPTRRPGVRKAGLTLAALGALCGPYLGVWMSLVASDRAPLGVAQTLCSLTPVFILPVVAVVHKERISLRAATGALVAVAGVALLVQARIGA